MRYGELRGRPEDFAAFDDPGGDSAEALLGAQHGVAPRAPQRLVLDPEKAERGLVQLVLTLVELLRQLVEKQSLRRIEGGSLTPEEVEKLGLALVRLENQMQELKDHFKIKDLNIDLGPLGNLLD